MQINTSAIEELLSEMIQRAVNQAFENRKLEEKVHQTVEKKIINFNECCSLLNIASSTLYSKTSSGQIPFLKKGRKLLFDREKVLEWLKK